jgi:hypothetical protein
MSRKNQTIKQPKENFKIAEEAFLFIRDVYEKIQHELERI